MAYIRSIAGAAMLLAGALATPAAAQEPRKLKEAQVVTGACTHVLMSGSEVASHCQARLILMHMTDGRMQFTFMLGEDDQHLTVLSFEGDVGKQTTLAAGRVRQPIDQMVLTLADAPAPKTAEASGECTFRAGSDPGEVCCVERTAQSAVEATFVSDGKGSPPKVF